MAQLWGVRIEQVDTVTVAHVEGDVDLLAVAELQPQLDRLCAATAGPVLLDLSEVAFLSSPGLSLLVRLHRQCQQRHQALRILAPTRVTYRPIRLTGLDTELPVVTGTLHDALSTLTAPGHPTRTHTTPPAPSTPAQRHPAHTPEPETPLGKETR